MHLVSKFQMFQDRSSFVVTVYIGHNSGTDATDAHTHKSFPVITLVLVYTRLWLEYPMNWCIRNRAAMGATQSPWSLRDRGKGGMQNNVPSFLFLWSQLVQLLALRGVPITAVLLHWAEKIVLK